MIFRSLNIKTIFCIWNFNNFYWVQWRYVMNMKIYSIEKKNALFIPVTHCYRMYNEFENEISKWKMSQSLFSANSWCVTPVFPIVIIISEKKSSYTWMKCAELGVAYGIFCLSPSSMILNIDIVFSMTSSILLFTFQRIWVPKFLVMWNCHSKFFLVFLFRLSRILAGKNFSKGRVTSRKKLISNISNYNWTPIFEFTESLLIFHSCHNLLVFLFGTWFLYLLSEESTWHAGRENK